MEGGITSTNRYSKLQLSGEGKTIALENSNHSIGLIDRKSASAAVANAFAMLPVINVFRAMANAETLYPPYIEYLSRLFQTLNWMRHWNE